MADFHPHVDADPKDLENAQDFWTSFTKFVTEATLAVAALVFLIVTVFLA